MNRPSSVNQGVAGSSPARGANLLRDLWIIGPPLIAFGFTFWFQLGTISLLASSRDDKSHSPGDSARLLQHRVVVLDQFRQICTGAAL